MDEICPLLIKIVNKFSTGLTFTELKQKLQQEIGTVNEATLSNHIKHLLLSQQIRHENKRYSPPSEIIISYTPQIIHNQVDIDLKHISKNRYHYKKIYHVENLSNKVLDKYLLTFQISSPQTWKEPKIKLTRSDGETYTPNLKTDQPLTPQLWHQYVEIAPPLLKNEILQITYEMDIQYSKLPSQMTHFFHHPVKKLNFSITTKENYNLEVYKINSINFDWDFLHQENVKKLKDKITWSETFDLKDFIPYIDIQFRWFSHNSKDKHLPSIS